MGADSESLTKNTKAGKFFYLRGQPEFSGVAHLDSNGKTLNFSIHDKAKKTYDLIRHSAYLKLQNDLEN